MIGIILNIIKMINDNYSQFIIALLAVVSAIIAFNSYQNEKKRKRIDKAIQLAQFYQEHIIPGSAMIYREIQGSKFDEVSAKAFSSIKNAEFSYTEAKTFLEQSNTEFIEGKELLIDVDPDAIFSAKVYIGNWDIYIQSMKNVYTEAEQRDDAELLQNIKKQLANDVQNDIRQLLNTLEWFSMYFVNHIADEKTAYQSLHQTYLGIVRQLYYFISERNCDEYNKYYTNIIELYNKWQTKSDKMRKREEKIIKKLSKTTKRISKTRHNYH